LTIDREHHHPITVQEHNIWTIIAQEHNIWTIIAWGYRHIQTCAGYRHCTTLTADHPSEASTIPTPIVVVVFTIVGSAPPLTIQQRGFA